MNSMEVLGDVVGTYNRGSAICAAAAGPLEFAGIDLISEHDRTVLASPRHAWKVRGSPPRTSASQDDRTVRHWQTYFHSFLFGGLKVDYPVNMGNDYIYIF